MYRHDNAYAQGRASERQPFEFKGHIFDPWEKNSHWKCRYPVGVLRLARADRLALPTPKSIAYVRYLDDFAVQDMANVWLDTQTGAFTDDKIYVVQTNAKVVERCVLMATDPGDLVLDPTCGSGTTAYVAEQWGRRWITIDTSRVALALARARVVGARYPYYLLADSAEGRRREAEVTGTVESEGPTGNDVRQGFVYERVPHITLKSIANNAEIDVIWEGWRKTLEPLREDLNARLGSDWEEWQIPGDASVDWPAEVAETHRLWWEASIARQEEIADSITAGAGYEYLYDKPYEDKRKVRVAGPFTVESLSPHRVVAVDENDELLDRVAEAKADYGPEQDFARMILEQFATAGVQQARKDDRIVFAAVTPWPGSYICAEGRYAEDRGATGGEKRAGNLRRSRVRHGLAPRPRRRPRGRPATAASTC